jgi:gamma-glutamyl-gamma-aminobutyraldehyde dehydrogenase
MTDLAATVRSSLRTSAFIDGEFRPARTGATLETLEPGTGSRIAEVAACDEGDVDAAVSAARRSFEDGRWSGAAPRERKKVLTKLAELISERGDELALLDSMEAGKPISDCEEIDVPETASTFAWYGEAADKLFDAIAPTGREHLGLIMREPVGVVGAVLPWNFPALMLAWKAAPSLAAGNSVVVKPAEQTSLSALLLAELALEAGVPPGVLNVVPGLGETAGAALGLHPDVDVVSFTGSTEVGRLFLQYSAASNLKRVVLECGGKSPQIVMADAPDLDIVAEDVLVAGYWNMGENCTCGSRLLVHRSLQDELLAKIVERTRSDWPVGDPLDHSTRIGPLIEEDHLSKVLSYVQHGLDEGADLVIGGQRVLVDSGGFFFEPTVMTNVHPQARVAQEEIFGPVIAVLPFDTEDEATAIANATNYGLAASVWTKDLDTALRVSRRIKAGTVSVNCYSEGDVTTPFGGYKLSGFGGRDNGLEAFEQYVERKTIWIQTR